jgi:hypothetical protein
MEGRIVRWPYTHTELIGESKSLLHRDREYKIQTATPFESGVLHIGRRGQLHWQGFDFASGFDVELRYTTEVHPEGAIIGLDDDFDLTPEISKFLWLNRELITHRIEALEEALDDYRQHLRAQARWKEETLSYRFLADVYEYPASPEDLAKTLEKTEADLRIRKLLLEREDAFTSAFERMNAVTRCEAAAWWYLFWDDLWRRNHDSITNLRTHQTDFDPHYPTSIAYRPLPRSALETFLIQRGLYSGPKSKRKHFIHVGLLNKVYFRLNQIVFRGSDKDILAHLGDKSAEIDLAELDFKTTGNPSTLGTGGGTDHDDLEIRARPAFRWEGVYDDPMRSGHFTEKRRRFGNLGVWLGLTPVGQRKHWTNGVALDVKLDRGKYVLLEPEVVDVDSPRKP